MIFISYSWVDKKFAHRFAEFLHRSGNNIWIDYLSLDLNKPIKKQLFLAVKKSNYMILIRSTAAMNSRWVRYELKQAKKLGVNIVDLPIDFLKKHLILQELAELQANLLLLEQAETTDTDVVTH
ncbi:toll/interleukin-1 receptor domain-containing protein [Thiothrix litoralis]|jgi:hypothetical protein|uniref:Toll/interleukin-1 receptor domain-containing protein n=1 Tax=Thiothrix litoralis TaxID=2891210 RepID=A0ABX7WSD9_9GAMM|nr:toll/interleukin-1 receptor domain-containing protein [Thiothrix litoralis]QTR46796.1 toll/interleukin-1 receptor domain-containing protein [Thiothrix litoralis]